MSAAERQRIDLRLIGDDKNMIEGAAAVFNQSVSQFMLNSASQWATEVVKQHRRVILNGGPWMRVMDALGSPPSLDEKLKRAAKHLQGV